MLTLIALTALALQEPPAPPAPAEVRTRVMTMGPHGPDSLDKDGDGQVSREEFAAPMNDHFGRMDKDGDGRLSREELSAGHGMGEDHDVMIWRGAEGGPGEHRVEVRGDPGQLLDTRLQGTEERPRLVDGARNLRERRLCDVECLG